LEKKFQKLDKKSKNFRVLFFCKNFEFLNFLKNFPWATKKNSKFVQKLF